MEPYQQLEHEWAKFISTESNKYTPEQIVTCSSGTAALHLATEVLAQTQNGKQVIVPDYTMVSCARAVSLAGLEAVLVDCYEENYNIDGDLLYSLTSNKVVNLAGSVAAIMAVHVYGRLCGMETIYNLASDWSLFVIEDLAEAHGITPSPYSDAACWSFYKNKIIHGEEGGIIAFKKREHADKARRLRNIGFTPAHDYTHIPRGHNYRLANLLATPILKSLQLYQCDGVITPWSTVSRTVLEHRRYLEACHIKEHMVLGGLKCPADRDAPWVYDVRLPGMNKVQQAALVYSLQIEGIQARFGFKPISQQEEYKKCTKISSMGVADKLATEVFYLPLVDITEAQIERAWQLIGKTWKGIQNFSK